MAPKRGSDDIGWQYGIMLENRHNFKCNYCDFTGQGGGVSRLKKHLAGGPLAGYHDVQGCKSVPREVKKLMIEHLKQVRAETARKKADKEIQERIISGRERDKDVDDEVEMYAEYVPDPDVQERLARAQSRAETWEGDQRATHRVSFQGTQHEVGSGSGSGSAVGSSGSRRFSNVGDYFTRPPPTQTQVPEQGRHSKRPTGVQIEDVDPYVYPREHGKQTRIDDAYNQQGPKYKVGRAIAKWWHHTGLPFNAANNPYYKTAIQEVQCGSLHVQPPTARDLAGKYLQESNFAGTSDGKEVEGIVNSSNFLDRVFKLVQIIEPLYEVLRVVDGDRRPSIGLVYAKLEAAKKKIREVSPRHAHLVLDVVEDRWDWQMSRHLHMAAYYLHPAYHYTHELAYEDDLTAAFTRIKSFREAIGTFAEPSAIAGRERGEGADWWFNFGHTAPTLRKIAVKILSQTSSSSGCERNWSTFALIHTKMRNRLSYRRLDQLVYVHYNMRLRVKHLTQDPKQCGEVEYDPVDIGFLRDEEDPMVSWVARATTERGEYELDEEADDPDDPPRPNTFLARAVAEATVEEEGDRVNVGQPYSPHYEMDPEAEVDLLGDIELELHERRGGGRVVLLQMLEVTVVVTVEVEVVTVVREEEMVTMIKEEEVVGWNSHRSNFMGVQHKIVVMVPQCGTIEGRSLDLAVKQEVHQWIPIAMTL
ncbi:hypothetical protein Taro_027538 [Colocasia esculenta]|uniref:BED-type domain-containing protein n=1 Tax=Colocasia esculenta TaxID=4460 RepID=A0A843VID2_COLES|nr:hypothetical protein [Colocasia esculenta]